MASAHHENMSLSARDGSSSWSVADAAAGTTSHETRHFWNVSLDVGTTLTSTLSASPLTATPPQWKYLGLAVIPAWIMFGNFLVLLAVIKQRNLRTLSNFVIASLAVTDFFLALVVVPLGAYQLVSY